MDTYDPRKIDVSLSLLSGADTAAAKDLATHLEGVAESFDSIRGSFSGYESKLAKIVQQLEQISKASQDTGGGRSVAPNAPQDRQRANPLQPPTAAEAAANTAAADAAASGQPPVSGNGGTSRPVQAKGAIGQWIAEGYQAAHNKGQESSVNWAQRSIGSLIGGALGKEQMADVSSGDSSMIEAAMREPINTYYGVKGAIDTTRAVANQFPELRFVGAADRAMAAGYERGGTIGIGGYGFQNPFSGEAAGEAWRTMKDSFKARTEAGITAEDAERINADLSEAGMTGDMGSQVYNKLMKPLWKDYKMDSGLIKQFLSPIRTGDKSIEEVKEQMEGLASSARAAGVSIDSMAEGAAKMGELNQATGGTFYEGVEKARLFSNITGAPSGRFADLMQNPMVQSMMAAQGGLPPQLQGAMGINSSMNAIDGAMDLMEQTGRAMGEGFGNLRTPIKDPRTGEILGYETTSKKKIGQAFAATQMGMGVDEYRKYRRNEDRMAAGSALEALLEQGPNATGRVGDDKLMDLGKQAGISKKYLDQARSAKSFEEGRKALEAGMRESRRDTMEKDLPKVKIELSPEAKKLFNIDGRDAVVRALKEDANAGRGTVTGVANGPRGPQPLQRVHGKGF